MTYRVLARKWRPNSLDDLVGQPALVQTLRASIERQQLHHAYLFTGTRGVGKTSIARILAKCLNCEQGITAEPCQKCSACESIAQGRFPDLIEVDAASRTRVEETRDLLDNVPYAPTQGRFKVYLIDEVHMLSAHSFNALLKTLEEPPEHVKFFLATTDPQRLPVTILSRCLQFHLKALTPDNLIKHLAKVCTAEQVPYQDPALKLIAQSATGSVRDALSLLEQAIAYGQGSVESEHVMTMLGTSSEQTIITLLERVLEADVRAALALVDEMASNGVIFEGAVDQLITLSHQLCITQVVPERLDISESYVEKMKHLASSISPDRAQLIYQLGLYAKRDFAWAQDAKTAFEMFVLRLCNFHRTSVQNTQSSLLQPLSGQISPPQLASNHKASAKTAQLATATRESVFTAKPGALDWPAFLKALSLTGLNKIVLEQAQLVRWEAPNMALMIPAEHEACLSEERTKSLEMLFGQLLNTPVKLELKVDATKKWPLSPAQLTRSPDEPQAAPVDNQAHIEEDKDLQALVDAFDATIEKVTLLKGEK